MRERSRPLHPALMTLPLALALGACTAMLTHFGGVMPEELRANGVAATATVLEVWDTGITINDDPVIGMRVRVRPADREPFEATIPKTMVSRIAVAQFQPGAVIPVKYDPSNPGYLAVDPDGGAPPPEVASSSPPSGNAFKDGFTAAATLGKGVLRLDAEPRLFLGTGDSGADAQALFEGGYTLLGSAVVPRGADLVQATAKAKEIEAALVVVYGRFAGAPLEVLPYRPRSASAATDAPLPTWAEGLYSGLDAEQRFAAFWGKTPPGILGVVCRPLEPGERDRFKGGVVVEAVMTGSPAEQAGLASGDVLVAIDGQPLNDLMAMPGMLTPHAGSAVRLDVMRTSGPSVVTAQLAANR